MRLSFRPQLWPTLMAVPAFFVLLAFGSWQLERLAWKSALIAERAERSSAAPVEFPTLPLALSAEERAGFEFRRAAVTGSFLHERETYLAARSPTGEPGYQVMVPLLRADGSAVLVNRGFVPIERKDPATRAQGQVRGVVEVEGLIRLTGRTAWFVPDNEPAKNMWFWVDLPALSRHLGFPEEAWLYLDAGPASTPGGWPKGGQTHLVLPNDHLQYAITWYALALALAVIYLVYHRRRPEGSL